MKTRVSSDGNLHLSLPIGAAEAGKEVQVTVVPLAVAPKKPLLASDLLRSDLVGIWAERTDITNNHDFARHLREQAQTRRTEL